MSEPLNDMFVNDLYSQRFATTLRQLSTLKLDYFKLEGFLVETLKDLQLVREELQVYRDMQENLNQALANNPEILDILEDLQSKRYERFQIL